MSKESVNSAVFDGKPFLGSKTYITDDKLLKPITKVKNNKRVPKLEEWENNLVCICRNCKKFTTMFERAICEPCYENKTTVRCEKCKQVDIPHHRVLCEKCWETQFAEKIRKNKEKETDEDNEAVKKFIRQKEERTRKEKERRKMFREMEEAKIEAIRQNDLDKQNHIQKIMDGRAKAMGETKIRDEFEKEISGNKDEISGNKDEISDKDDKKKCLIM